LHIRTTIRPQFKKASSGAVNSDQRENILSHQRTLERVVRCEGIGLHTGRKIAMALTPAPANRGVVFRRMDLPGAPAIEARPEHVADTQNATTLARNGASVRTVEHLMSALAGMGVDNVLVDLTGPEVPILDGSAAPFVNLLRRAGLRRQFAPKTFLKVRQPIAVELGTRSLRIVPSQRLKVIYTMCFDHPVLGEQTVALEVSRERYAREVAPSRTYGFLKDLDMLARLGLAKGGSPENALVIGEEGVLNGPLRFPDELVRHKILDLLGDLYLLGKPLVGTIIAHGAGHQLHVQLVRRIQEHLGMAPEPLSLSASPVEQWVSPLLPASRPLKAAAV
jgi:UDP-3-O-[3-hydroxymyristoyl] N-acetylglucosamine deacetylase